MKTCNRPHCAIRSHNHDIEIIHNERLTFAKYHNYLPKFCEIANRYSLDDKDLIQKYIYLMDCTIENSKVQFECVKIVCEMLSDIEGEMNGLELKKLKILYLFTMISSPAGKILRLKYPKLANTLEDSYQRMLIEGRNDKDFITQIVFNYRLI